MKGLFDPPQRGQVTQTENGCSSLPATYSFQPLPCSPHTQTTKTAAFWPVHFNQLSVRPNDTKRRLKMGTRVTEYSDGNIAVTECLHKGLDLILSTAHTHSYKCIPLWTHICTQSHTWTHKWHTHTHTKLNLVSNLLPTYISLFFFFYFYWGFRHLLLAQQR